MKDEKNNKEEEKELGTDVEKEVTDGVSVIFHIIFIYLFFFGLIIFFFGLIFFFSQAKQFWAFRMPYI